MEQEQRVKKEMEEIGHMALLCMVVFGPIALTVWLATIGWMGVAYHWAMACWKG